jgi:phosphate starvation-inducible PhoH-like protein
LLEKLYQYDIALDDVNPIDFYGINNEKLDILKKAFPDVKIVARGNIVKTQGERQKIEAIHKIISSILQEIRMYGMVDAFKINDIISRVPFSDVPLKNEPPDVILRGVNGNLIRPKTPGQRRLVSLAEENELVFAIGPAGSGKTYTAVALAVRALRDKFVKKIVLVRPAVEAGEKLGFLPGDLKDKIDPYLRPLYDSLEDMILPEKLQFYLEKNIIEIVPLAYMRGRTLNNSFIILDEAQNATETQMKMLLTRMGYDSRIIITGDTTQIDLPKSQKSGLIQCTKILKNIAGIAFVFLTEEDVVRHKLVKKILAAYAQSQEESSAGDTESEKNV